MRSEVPDRQRALRQSACDATRTFLQVGREILKPSACLAGQPPGFRESLIRISSTEFLCGDFAMVSGRDHETFLQALSAWAAGDFEGLMALFHDDITYIVNVDGMAVPYAMSSVGKNDVRDRLGFLLHTFDVTTFDIESAAQAEDHSRAQIHGVYHHKATGEVLDIRPRFKAWFRDGLIVRAEEIQDAPFVEAFERFVFQTQCEGGDGA